MADLNSLCSRIGAIFSEQMNLEVPSVDTDLFDTGLLDSLAFVNLLTCLEQKFGIAVSVDDLEIENFRTVARIAAFAASKNGFNNNH